MPTALVVDPAPDARRRVGALLRLGGWSILDAADAQQALRLAAPRDLDLVVTEVLLPGQTGLWLLDRLRRAGSRARFLVVTADPTEHTRTAAAGVGALACLAKPIEPWALIDFLRRRAADDAAPRARRLRLVRDDEEAAPELLDAGTMQRLRQMYVLALPQRLSSITGSARAGDAMAVASAAQTLAGASGQLGHPQLAAVCQEIAAEARRGVVTPSRLAQLRLLGARAAANGYATSR